MMRRDVERALFETEEFLRRQLGSRAAREAGKRKVQQGMREVLRRARRAALVFVALFLLLVTASVFLNVGLLTWVFALPAILLTAMITLFWPTRQRTRPRPPERSIASVPLARLAAKQEEWLLAHCSDLPRAALPATDFILSRLQELQPELARLPADEPIAGETRRLLGQHLPRLVECYLDLPASQRDPQGENSRRFAESMDTVAEELDRLSQQIGHERLTHFQTQSRFIESRYRDEA